MAAKKKETLRDLYLGSVLSATSGKSLQEITKDIFAATTETIATDIKMLTPSQRVNLAVALLPYLVPKIKEQESNCDAQQNNDIAKLFDNGTKNKTKGNA